MIINPHKMCESEKYRNMNELVCDFIAAFLTPDFSGSASFALEFIMALSLLAPSIVGVATSSFSLR